LRTWAYMDDRTLALVNDAPHDLLARAVDATVAFDEAVGFQNNAGSPSPRPRVTNPTHPGVASLPCLGPPVCSPGVASLPRPAADLPHPHHTEVASLPPPIPRSARPSPCPHTLLNIWVSAFTLVIRTCPS